MHEVAINKMMELCEKYGAKYDINEYGVDVLLPKGVKFNYAYPDTIHVLVCMWDGENEEDLMVAATLQDLLLGISECDCEDYCARS